MIKELVPTQLLDITIDKLSIVADFKEGIKKDEFIRVLTSTSMMYVLQSHHSRNFGYEEVLKAESLDCGYLELAGDIKKGAVDLPQLIRHRISLESQIEQEKTSREAGESLLSNEEYQHLFENLEDVKEMIAETDEDGRLTDARKLKRYRKQLELSIEQLEAEVRALKSDIDKQELLTDFKNEVIESLHQDHIDTLLKELGLKEKLIITKTKELTRAAEMESQLDENGFLPNNRKKKTDRLLKDVRFEFNPKHMLYNNVVYQVILTVLKLLTNIEITGIHIACDYPVKTSDLKIKDLSSKTECIFLNRDKELETMYIGKRGSDNHICIYNKKAENEANGTLDQYPDIKHVTRFESRLRKNKAKEWIDTEYNPFESIIVGDLERIDGKLKLNDRIILEAIMSDYHGRYFGMMDKDQKRTWRKKIIQHVPKLFDVAEDYRQKKSQLIAQLTDLLG
ncbi:replication initiation factor domain-containing protein [Bacillus sp. OTU530]|uniref:replication initiation factor domain-containing protein n=1 Tax=Bacillus sp. OTU530 TaxID=3043862 RepID=UPI00313D7164